MKHTLICILIACSSFGFAQKFEGVITYSVEIPVMMLRSIPPEFHDSLKITRKIIKNDRIRTESFTGMGKQVMLEKIGSDTSYLLMTLMGKDIAIEIVGEPKPESPKDSLKIEGKAPKMFGYKCSKASYTKYGKTYEVIYTKDIDKAYGNSFTMLGGVALQFPIVMGSQETLLYKCTSVATYPIDDSYYRIPDKYKVVSMEEFGKMIGG